MIDLHTHTTASDGRCTPADLVIRAKDAGVTVLSVTDHDTVAACAAAQAACADAAMEFVTGIEITAVRSEADIHILGYFIDPASAPLLAFLAAQRQQRLERIRRMIDRLRPLGITLDADAILQPAIANPNTAVGRPWIARALVAAGHVATTSEAFDLWLARGRPAFVPRDGAAPGEVIARIHDAGGVASLAHPGLVGRDGWIREFAAAGLDAIEAYHTDHDRAATAHYRATAERLALAITGGSDYHADESHGAPRPGSTSLPPDDYERLRTASTTRTTTRSVRL